MRLLRVMGELSQLRREFRELTTESAAEEEKAKYELTASARKFSRDAKDLVDDKMTFSATLMRAGEVDAANRLLEEVEQDVRVEEVALIEKMNEVKMARATKRERMTRNRLARLMAVSLAGSMVMGFSALGMAAASFVQEREQDQARQNFVAQRRATEDGGRSRARGEAVKKLMGLDKQSRKLLLLQAETGNLSLADVAAIQTFGQAGNVGALESLLTEVLDSPDLARQIASQITNAVDRVVSAAPEAPESSVPALAAPKVKKKAKKATEETAQSEPEPSPSPEESEAPAEEAGDKGDKQETEGGGSDEQESSNPEDDLPLDDQI